MEKEKTDKEARKKEVGVISPVVPTGIPGFDEMIGGGFERTSIYLVVGGCGVGKSIFSMQYLYNGATKFNENGVYITLEEHPDKIKKHYAQFGWDLQALEDENKFRIIHIKPRDVMNFIQGMSGELYDAVSDVDAKRIVFDSITSIEEVSETNAERKEMIFKLFEDFEKLHTTPLLISESEQTLNAYSRNGVMEFMVDGVIVLYNVKKENTRENALEVLKMRGRSHMKKIVPFKIDKGIRVYPEEEVFK